MTKSEDIKDLAKALSMAQAEIKGAITNATNPFFKSSYADLSSVWDAIRIPFSKNGLSISQMICETDKGSVLETILMHSSGQWLLSQVSIRTTKNDPQGFVAGVTYARRCSLSAISGCAEIDDDGNEASDKGKHIACIGGNFNATRDAAGKNEQSGSIPESAANEKDFPNLENEPPISQGGPSQKQIKRLFAIANKSGWSTEDVKKFLNDRYKINSTKDLTISNYDFICSFIEGSPKT